jgi:hypothetical protein
LLQTYTELNTPLPFIVGGWLLRVAGPGEYPLRLLMFVLSFLTVSGLCVASRGRVWPFVGSALGLMLFPYFWFCSVLYYTDMLAIFFIVMGLLAYQRTWHGLAALSFVGAICTRQFMVVFPAAILLYEAIALYLPSLQTASLLATLRRYGYALLYVGAVASLGGWVWLWHGLAPSAEMARQQYGSHTTPLDGGFMLYAMACLGLYGAVVEAVLFRKWTTYLTFFQTNSRFVLGLAGLLGVFALLFPASQHINAFAVVPHMGPLDRLMLDGGVPFWGRQVVYWALACVCLCRLRMAGFSLLTVCWLLNILLMGATQVAWDKYLMPAITVFWLFNVIAGTTEPVPVPSQVRRLRLVRRVLRWRAEVARQPARVG